jgi:sucrose-6-phosphate hydrolase SacC (GH32 family)
MLGTNIAKVGQNCVVLDRSVIEAFAAGGRAVLTGRDYPAQEETSAHLFVRSGSAGLTFSRVDAWAMGCAWVE